MYVILASASPRRRELLGQIGIDFDVKVSEAEAWRIRAYRLCVLVVPSFWLVVFFRMCNFI